MNLKKNKKIYIKAGSRDLALASVQDLLDTPAAEQEIQALLHRLDEAVGKVATQEALASSQTHRHVPKMLSQSGRGHGLGKRTLGVHGSAGRISSDQLRPGLGCSWGLLSVPAASFTYNLPQERAGASIHVLLLLDCSVHLNIC